MKSTLTNIALAVLVAPLVIPAMLLLLAVTMLLCLSIGVVWVAFWVGEIFEKDIQ